jgi:hypothetical protein
VYFAWCDADVQGDAAWDGTEGARHGQEGKHGCAPPFSVFFFFSPHNPFMASCGCLLGSGCQRAFGNGWTKEYPVGTRLYTYRFGLKVFGLPWVGEGRVCYQPRTRESGPAFVLEEGKFLLRGREINMRFVMFLTCAGTTEMHLYVEGKRVTMLVGPNSPMSVINEKTMGVTLARPYKKHILATSFIARKYGPLLSAKGRRGLVRLVLSLRRVSMPNEMIYMILSFLKFSSVHA